MSNQHLPPTFASRVLEVSHTNPKKTGGASDMAKGVDFTAHREAYLHPRLVSAKTSVLVHIIESHRGEAKSWWELQDEGQRMPRAWLSAAAA